MESAGDSRPSPVRLSCTTRESAGFSAARESAAAFSAARLSASILAFMLGSFSAASAAFFAASSAAFLRKAETGSISRLAFLVAASAIRRESISNICLVECTSVSAPK